MLTKDQIAKRIAQELEEIFPALIEESNDIIKDENGENVETGEKTKNDKQSLLIFYINQL